MKKVIFAAAVLFGMGLAATAQTKQVPNAAPAQAGKPTTATMKSASPVSTSKDKNPIKENSKIPTPPGTPAAGPTNATAKPKQPHPTMSAKMSSPASPSQAKQGPTSATSAPAKGAPKK